MLEVVIRAQVDMTDVVEIKPALFEFWQLDTNHWWFSDGSSNLKTKIIYFLKVLLFSKQLPRTTPQIVLAG